MIGTPLVAGTRVVAPGYEDTVLGLSVDRAGPDVVRTFLRERDITYPVAIVGRDVETAFGGMQGYPTSILLDRTGSVRYKVLGPLAMASLEPAVRRLLRDTVVAPR